jgi:hypothetical protein
MMGMTVIRDGQYAITITPQPVAIEGARIIYEPVLSGVLLGNPLWLIADAIALAAGIPLPGLLVAGVKAS